MPEWIDISELEYPVPEQNGDGIVESDRVILANAETAWVGTVMKVDGKIVMWGSQTPTHFMPMDSLPQEQPE